MVGVKAKCVVDTNVPKLANLHVNIASIPEEKLACVLACAEKIQGILNGNFSLVIDAADEIFDEYRRQLSMSGQPGVGDVFMQWVHDNRWGFPDEDRVAINKIGHTYGEFPVSEKLISFDKSDMKFVAVANAHVSSPPIVVAEDRGWFLHKDALENVGIVLEFLCPINS